jgi:hypothetical protein
MRGSQDIELGTNLTDHNMENCEAPLEVEVYEAFEVEAEENHWHSERRLKY